MIYFPLLILAFSCNELSPSEPSDQTINAQNISVTDTVNYPPNSWQYFLQHLPIKKGAIIDYKGNKISNQAKHFAIVDYDIGNTDLQQCADALIRLRAEYLFSQKRFSEIGFHFTSGHYYSWEDYCKGKRPFIRGNKVYFTNSVRSDKTHASLRKYFDIVYTYAGTISLNKELFPANSFEIGTVVIWPGSPGHCFIIIDKTVTKEGIPLYKLVEGYTPAQSIYVLANNTSSEELSPWCRLFKNEVINTASYTFTNYHLKKFE
jgi:hypothetical protein